MSSGFQHQSSVEDPKRTIATTTWKGSTRPRPKASHMQRPHGGALGLDIDGTITAAPIFFAELSRVWTASGAKVHVISTRSDLPEVRLATEALLAELGIVFDGLHLLPGPSHAGVACPHDDLDWYGKWLWQKVDLARKLRVESFYDDDARVIALFRRFAPEINLFRIDAAQETTGHGGEPAWSATCGAIRPDSAA